MISRLRGRDGTRDYCVPLDCAEAPVIPFSLPSTDDGPEVLGKCLGHVAGGSA